MRLPRSTAAYPSGDEPSGDDTFLAVALLAYRFGGILPLGVAGGLAIWASAVTLGWFGSRVIWLWL